MSQSSGDKKAQVMALRQLHHEFENTLYASRMSLWRSDLGKMLWEDGISLFNDKQEENWEAFMRFIQTKK
jgi:hypothetical protein